MKRPSDYHEQTYASPHWIVRHAHRARYRAVVKRIRENGVIRLLDYGAGTGYLLVELGHARAPDMEVVAFEPIEAFAKLIPTEIEGIQRPIRVVQNLSELGDEQFDAITCLAVLEHMPLPERKRFYDLCDRNLAPRGSIVIDVPIEAGLSVLIKEAGRILLKGREPEYSLRQLMRAALGRVRFDPARFDPDNPSTWIHHHTGFDHRLLGDELAHRFHVRERFPTPMPRVPALLGNQEVIYVAEAADG